MPQKISNLEVVNNHLSLYFVAAYYLVPETAEQKKASSRPIYHSLVNNSTISFAPLNLEIRERKWFAEIFYKDRGRIQLDQL